MLAIEFEYSCSHCSINYFDVQYGDPQMRKHVETKASFLLIELEQGYIAVNIENNLQEPPKSPNLTLFLFVSLI